MIEEILRRPVSVIVATIALAALGGFSLLALPLSLLPQVERPSLLVTAKAAASSRDELLQEVWGYEHTPSTRTVDVHVAWLRQKLEANPKVPQLIQTVHGLGYKFTG